MSNAYVGIYGVGARRLSRKATSHTTSPSKAHSRARLSRYGHATTIIRESCPSLAMACQYCEKLASTGTSKLAHSKSAYWNQKLRKCTCDREMSATQQQGSAEGAMGRPLSLVCIFTYVPRGSILLAPGVPMVRMAYIKLVDPRGAL